MFADHPLGELAHVVVFGFRFGEFGDFDFIVAIAIEASRDLLVGRRGLALLARLARLSRLTWAAGLTRLKLAGLGRPGLRLRCRIVALLSQRRTAK